MTLSHRDRPGNLGDTRNHPCPSKHRNLAYEALCNRLSCCKRLPMEGRFPAQRTWERPDSRLGYCKRLPKRPRQRRRLHDRNAPMAGPGPRGSGRDWPLSLGIAWEPGCSQGGVGFWGGDGRCHRLDMARA
jgi:hypothetical protein